MQGRTEFQQQKLQTYEIRQNQYQNTWKVPLMDTILKKPLCKLPPQAMPASSCMHIVDGNHVLNATAMTSKICAGCIFSAFCPNCVSYLNRKQALYGDMTRCKPHPSATLLDNVSQLLQSSVHLPSAAMPSRLPSLVEAKLHTRV